MNKPKPKKKGGGGAVGGTVAQIPTQKEVAGKTRKEKCISCGKQFLTFLFSTIGLSLLMIAYTIFGAFIFKELEAPAESTLRHNMNARRKWHVDYLWNLTLEMNVFFKDNWTREAERLFKNYTDNVYQATELGWNGLQDADYQEINQWSFPASMLYSITVITTIGFGHITPKTMWGRVVTILYAIVGIPLTLLTITNLGGFMASAFRFIYRDICCGLFCRCCKTDKNKQEKKIIIQPKTKYKDVPNPGETAVSLTAGSDDIDAAEGGCGSNGEALGVTEPINRAPGHQAPQGNHSTGSHQLNWSHGVQRSLTTKDNKTVSVPIYVSLLLITGYILAGAMLFTFWEKEWDFFIGAYFCFITLTTIGFGDYVPGTSIDSWDSQQKLVLCALYLILGLALIAMCFDLMQEEVRQGCRKLGQKIGFISADGVSKKVKKGKKSKRRNSSKLNSQKSLSSSKKKKYKDSKKMKNKDKGSLPDITEGEGEELDIRIYGKKLSSADNLWLEGGGDSPWIKRNVSWPDKDLLGPSSSSCSTPKHGSTLDRPHHYQHHHQYHIQKAESDQPLSAAGDRRGYDHHPLTSGMKAGSEPSTMVQGEGRERGGGSSEHTPQLPRADSSVVFTVDMASDNPPMMLTRYPAYDDRPTPKQSPPTYHSLNT